jgi:hypothetical protein
LKKQQRFQPATSKVSKKTNRPLFGLRRFMPEYYVTTHHDPSTETARVQVIKADRYEQADSGDYHFYIADPTGAPGNKKILVSSVSNRGIFSIIESEQAYQGDFLANLGDEDETDDVCIDCRNQELLESDEFVDAVWDIVHAFLAPDYPEPLTLFYAKNTTDSKAFYGKGSWGFWYKNEAGENRFVPFGLKPDAEDGLRRHNDGNHTGWYTWPLSEAEITEPEESQ